MIKNSTEKFKEKYEKSIHKRSGSMKNLKLTNNTNYSQFTHRNSTFNVICRSTAKTETLKSMNMRTLASYDNSPNGKSKYQVMLNTTEERKLDNLLKKKGVYQKAITLKPKIKKNRIFSNMKINQDPQQFIENLKKNQLFFCCQCYQYVYQIQKKRHYPQCKDQILNLDRANIEDKAFIALERLQRILKLAKYTNNRSQQIEEMYQAYEKGNYFLLQDYTYPAGLNFYTFQEINYAFLYIYNKLAKNIHNIRTSPSKFACNCL